MSADSTADAPDLLSHFCAPLTAVGHHDAPGRPNAQICVSVFGASIVLERPRLLVVLHRTNLTHDLVPESGTLAVTLLSEAQLELLEPLGLRSGRDGEKVDDLALRMTAADDSIFPDGVGFLTCEVLDATNLGDATAYLVAVRERASLGDGGESRTRDALGGRSRTARRAVPRSLDGEERPRARSRRCLVAVGLASRAASPDRCHSVHSAPCRGSSVGRAHD